MMSDMIRNNESPSNNSGARLVKYLQDYGFSNLEIMIFTSSKYFAFNELKKFGVKIEYEYKGYYYDK